METRIVAVALALTITVVAPLSPQALEIVPPGTVAGPEPAAPLPKPASLRPTSYEDGVAALDSGAFADALSTFRTLAEQEKGHAGAQFYLGFMYDFAKGVQQDFAEAAWWYRKAADQGLARAQFNLGVLYDYGLGVPQDYVEAHKWFNLAAAQNNDAARKNRDTIAKRMTPDDLSRAQRLAREWRPK